MIQVAWSVDAVRTYLLMCVSTAVALVPAERYYKFNHILNMPQYWIIHEQQSQTELSSQLISVEPCSILTTEDWYILNLSLSLLQKQLRDNWCGICHNIVSLEPRFSFRWICDRFARYDAKSLHLMTRTVILARYV